MEQSTAEHTKVPVVVRDDYVMYLEFYDGGLWLHTDVFKWTADIKQKYIQELEVLQFLTRSPLFALIETDNIKLSKFAKYIGFKFFKAFTGNNNEQYYIWSRGL